MKKVVLTEPKPARPVLRWHGGKWILASWIIKHFPPHKFYTEAYGGAGSVLLKKPRSYAEVWNDVDSELVTFFRILRDRKQSAELRRALALTPFSRDEFEAAYELADDPIEISRRLVVRSYMGFGSNAPNRGSRTGFRSCSNRSSTTPAHDWRNYPVALSSAIRRLRGVVIENREAVKVLLQHDNPETLHYVDPPYVHATRGNGHDVRQRYSREMFGEDHENLARVLKELKGMVVLSGYPGALYSKLFSDWQHVSKHANADGARARTEVLWFNQKAADRLK